MEKLDSKQIKKQSEQISDFLKLVHPFLAQEDYSKECIELRPINREKGFIKGLNLWKLDNKGMEYLVKFFKSINGKPVEAYFSSFTMEHDKRSTYINKEKAQYTTVFAMDWDGISEEEFLKEKNRINELGIEMVETFTGHGYQTYILLSEKIFDKDIYRKFTNLMTSKGFKIDTSIIDAARVLRLPYTFNCKAFKQGDKYYEPENPQGIPTRLLNTTTKRYSAKEVFEKIGSIKTDSDDLMDTMDKEFGLGLETHTEKIEDTRYIDIEDSYSMIAFEALPSAVKNILREGLDGYRNLSYMFLIPFFRSIGYDINTIKSVLVVWGTQFCDIPLDKSEILAEVDRIWTKGYKFKYTDDLKARYGLLEMMDKYSLDNKVLIPAEVFELYDIISPSALKIYLAMLTREKTDEIVEWTKEDIMEAADISLRTFRTRIEELVKNSLLDKRRGYKKNGKAYTYFVNKYYDRSKGFVLFETSLIEQMIYHRKRALTDGEIKLYTYLRFIARNKDKCWAGQEYIGKKIDRQRHSVSEMTDKLVEKKYIRKIHRPYASCEYILNY